MSKALMRSFPYVEAAHQGKKQKPKAISICLSDTTSTFGSALLVANYWHRRTSEVKSCHYVVDEGQVIQCVMDNRVAFSAPSDTRGILSINVCAQPTPFVEFWKDEDYSAVLDRTARLVAKLSKTYNIKVRPTDLLGIRRFFPRRGIMISVKGAWPNEDFLALVNTYIKQGGA